MRCIENSGSVAYALEASIGTTRLGCTLLSSYHQHHSKLRNIESPPRSASSASSVCLTLRLKTELTGNSLICDGFETHETLEVLEFCFENRIILCRLPSHTSHKLQPCDASVFGPLKAAYRDEVERLEREKGRLLETFSKAGRRVDCFPLT